MKQILLFFLLFSMRIMAQTEWTKIFILNLDAAVLGNLELWPNHFHMGFDLRSFEGSACSQICWHWMKILTDGEIEVLCAPIQIVQSAAAQVIYTLKNTL
jgi:hypothetical protein